MAEMLVLRGLPGSGKSTIAARYVSQGYFRVNKDDLREAHPKANERWIHEHQMTLIGKAIERGESIVVDNTNLNQRTVNEYQRIAEHAGYEFSALTVQTPWTECILRDLDRKNKGERYVGRSVIFRMAVESGRVESTKEDFTLAGKHVVIFDIDGTLANTDHRQHFMTGEKKDWKGFFENMSNDTPYEDIVALAVDAAAQSNVVLIVSGRPEKYRRETEEWLDRYRVPYAFLFMRGFNDNRQDNIVKEEIYRKYIEPFFNVKYVYDDRQQVVDMWRRIGLRCLQVAPGDF